MTRLPGRGQEPPPQMRDKKWMSRGSTGQFMTQVGRQSSSEWEVQQHRLKGKGLTSSFPARCQPLCFTDDPQQALAALMNDVLLPVFMQLAAHCRLILCSGCKSVDNVHLHHNQPHNLGCQHNKAVLGYGYAPA